MGYQLRFISLYMLREVRFSCSYIGLLITIIISASRSVNRLKIPIRAVTPAKRLDISIGKNELVIYGLLS